MFKLIVVALILFLLNISPQFGIGNLTINPSFAGPCLCGPN